MRRKLVAAGCLLATVWLVCWSVSVVPDSAAVAMQWAAGNALAFLTGGTLGAAIVQQHRQ